MDEVQALAGPARRRRPLGVIIVTIGLLFTAAIAYLVAADALLEIFAPRADVPVLGESSDVVAFPALPRPVVAVGSVVAGTLALVVSVGFFRFRSWGWTGLMLLSAISLTVDLVAVVLGNPNEVNMAVAIVAVLYANQRRIQLLFRDEQVVAFEPARTSDVRSPE